MSEMEVKIVYDGKRDSDSLKRPKVSRKVDKLETLTSYIRGLTDQSFTGYLKINYSEGSIGRIEKFEEILKK